LRSRRRVDRIAQTAHLGALRRAPRVPGDVMRDLADRDPRLHRAAARRERERDRRDTHQPNTDLRAFVHGGGPYPGAPWIRETSRRYVGAAAEAQVVVAVTLFGHDA